MTAKLTLVNTSNWDTDVVYFETMGGGGAYLARGDAVDLHPGEKPVLAQFRRSTGLGEEGFKGNLEVSVRAVGLGEKNEKEPKPARLVSFH